MVLEAFLQVMYNDVNSSPAAALARSSIHQLTTSTDTMDLVCHGPSTANPDAPYNCLDTLHLCISTLCSDYQIIALASLRLEYHFYI